MTDAQQQQLDHIRDMQVDLTRERIDYWVAYSDLATVPFWVNVLSFVLPFCCAFGRRMV